MQRNKSEELLLLVVVVVTVCNFRSLEALFTPMGGLFVVGAVCGLLGVALFAKLRSRRNRRATSPE